MSDWEQMMVTQHYLSLQILAYTHLIVPLSEKEIRMQIHFAPLQGYTGFEYRGTHARHCGGVDTYYTPFIRWDKGGVRDKDIRDILPENNRGLHLIPQILCSCADDFNRLADAVQEQGYKEIDLNMGCPAPMQTRRRCGSGILPHPDMVQGLFREMDRRPEVRFSAKMRMGLEQDDEWCALADIINKAPLQHLCIHPRIGRQMYKGEVNMSVFRKMTERIHVPIIYNGDITCMEDIAAMEAEYPTLHGIMIGRGMLARPTLAQEYRRKNEMPLHDRKDILMNMHEDMLACCTRKYKVESQILLHIHAFWEYQEKELDRKVWKKIMKTGNMKNYLEAIRQL